MADVRWSVYANSIAFGKELAGVRGPLNSNDWHTRVLENVMNTARQLVAVEVRSQVNASSSRVFKGAVFQRARTEGGTFGQSQERSGQQGGRGAAEGGGGTGGGMNQGRSGGGAGVEGIRGGAELAGLQTAPTVTGNTVAITRPMEATPTPTPPATSQAVGAAAAASSVQRALINTPVGGSSRMTPPTCAQSVRSAAVLQEATAVRFSAAAVAATPLPRMLPGPGAVGAGS